MSNVGSYKLKRDEMPQSVSCSACGRWEWTNVWFRFERIEKSEPMNCVILCTDCGKAVVETLIERRDELNPLFPTKFLSMGLDGVNEKT